MAIVSISISLEDKDMFYAGDIVNGVCQVVTSKAVDLQTLEVTFTGKAHVHWGEGGGDQSVDSDAKHQIRPIQQDITIPNGSLAAGNHRFPFRFKLPKNLATSFEGEHGHIRYYLEGNVPTSLGLSPVIVPAAVKIVQPIDTNLPKYSFSVKATDVTTPGCCCFAQGQVTVSAETDRAAYCPDEKITMTAHFSNDSGRSVKPYARLIQKVQYFAENSNTSRYLSMGLVPKGGSGLMDDLAVGRSTDWNGVELVVPSVSPSIKLPIVEVNYVVEVGLEIPMAGNVEVRLPIVIGTIPFRGPRQPVVTSQPAKTLEVPWQGIGRRISGKIEPPVPAIEVASGDFEAKQPPPDNFQMILASTTGFAPKHS